MKLNDRCFVKSGMKYALILLLMLSTSATVISAQPREADPADVGSIDQILKAVYDVISGDAGVERDWDRLRTLFHKDARLIPSGRNAQTGMTAASVMSVEDYITANAPFFKNNGFHEREVARRVDRYGTLAHAFSTYEAFRKREEKTPFMRGINSIQLLYDGKRWWVMSIFWLAETPDNPLPSEYLKGRN
ncbi:hypothetical protein [Leptolyngbya sp. 7M]|uniref:hypothetical protein n=1 Tax=Leptolyngbya sp. 7M TaxID=2812896 RepID=UPI001B8AA01C|nr:hypothetical protein [Leptolyngbya sp. 7M]QYO65410.1 hypothetical protein JVX88_01090 [Leptolyngbya sp. 7M]